MTEILHGDVRDVLPTLDAESVQCVVTSPPYWGLRDYGVDGQLGLEATPDEYVSNMVEVFREVKRVLRDDGTLWLNIGDSYFGDSPARGKSSEGFSKTWDKSQTRSRGGTRRSAKSVGALRPKNLIGIPWRLAFALQSDGWYLRSDIIWAKGLSFCPSYAGSVMPESCTDRPTSAYEHVFLLTKQARYYYDAEAVRENWADDRNGAANGQNWDRPETQTASARRPQLAPKTTGRNLRNVWAINPQPFSEAHFATFPMALVEPCIKAGSRKGDTVLDPFAGSGTVGCVALKLGRTFVGIELNPDYCTMAKASIHGPLFT